jgi:hypothetical protein
MALSSRLALDKRMASGGVPVSMKTLGIFYLFWASFAFGNECALFIIAAAGTTTVPPGVLLNDEDLVTVRKIEMELWAEIHSREPNPEQILALVTRRQFVVGRRADSLFNSLRGGCVTPELERQFFYSNFRALLDLDAMLVMMHSIYKSGLSGADTLTDLPKLSDWLLKKLERHLALIQPGPEYRFEEIRDGVHSFPDLEWDAEVPAEKILPQLPITSRDRFVGRRVLKVRYIHSPLFSLTIPQPERTLPIVDPVGNIYLILPLAEILKLPLPRPVSVPGQRVWVDLP